MKRSKKEWADSKKKHDEQWTIRKRARGRREIETKAPQTVEILEKKWGDEVRAKKRQEK